MTTGVVPGVPTLPSAAELPLPPPPGLVVVAVGDPRRAAARVARVLGAGHAVTVAEACEELDRRREARLLGPRHRLARCAEAATAARARAVGAHSALPPALAGVSPDRLRRAAEAVGEAGRAAATARDGLGPRPALDEDAAREAREAQAAVEQARVDRAAALPAANSILAMANAGAAVVVAGRLVSDAFDPAFVLVAVLPLAGLGFAAHTVGRSVRRSRAAARRRWTALRSLDVCTMAGLDAREERAREWDARSARLAAAEAEQGRARAAWRALAGPTVAVPEAARVAAEMEEALALEAAAEEAGRAWAEAAVLLQAAEDGAGAGEAPLVVLDAEGSPDPRRFRAVQEDLARRGGRVPVVLLAARAAVGTQALPAPAPARAEDGHGADSAPAPAGPEDGHGADEAPAAVVDLRERVLAGLLRLRSGPPNRRNPSPPGSVASGG